MKNKGNFRHSKKLPIIIAGGALVLIIAILVGTFVSKGKSKEVNNNEEIHESEKVSIEQKLEYGDDISDKTFTVHIEDREIDVSFADLEPKVDTMVVGETEHELEVEEEKFDVTVVIEDTQKPVIKGVKDIIELKGENVDIEKELRNIITAEDPVDGELDVVFKSEEDKDEKNSYHVIAEATDVNDNKTTEQFKVIIVVMEKEEEEEEAENGEGKKGEEKPSSEGTTSKPKQEKPNKENSSSEKPKHEKPKQEKPNKGSGGTSESDNTGPKIKGPNGSLPGGASLTKKEHSSHTYAYKKDLPGGGYISEVVASSESGVNTVYIQGVDNKGNEFIGIYSPAKLEMKYFNTLPATTDDGYQTIEDVAEEFAVAYRWQDKYNMMEWNAFDDDAVHYYAANTNSKTLGEEIDTYNKYNEPKFKLKRTDGGRVIHSFNNVENNDKYEWIITSEDCKGGVCSKNVDSIKLDRWKRFEIMYVEK